MTFQNGRLMDNRITTDRTCGNCIGYKDGWCQLHQHATRIVNYGCRTHLTSDEFDAKIKEMDARLTGEKAVRVNYMLTLMYTFLNAGLTLITKSELEMGKLIGGKDWRFERKKAIKKIMANIEEIRSLYARYFEKDFIDMMTQYGESEFDSVQYDNFTADTADFLRLALTYYEHAYHNVDDKEKAIQMIASMPHDLNLFDEKFINSFKQR